MMVFLRRSMKLSTQRNFLAFTPSHPVSLSRFRSLCRPLSQQTFRPQAGPSYQRNPSYRHLCVPVIENRSSPPAASLAAPEPKVPANERESGPTQESLLRHIKQKATNNASRKIIVAVEEAEQGIGLWGSEGIRPDATTYRTAIRAILRANRTDLAIQLYRYRMRARAVRPSALLPDFPLAASVIKAVLRDCKKRGQKAMHSTDVFDDVLSDCQAFEQGQLLQKDELDVARMISSLFSISIIFLQDGDTANAQEALSAASALASRCECASLPVGECNSVIRVLGKNRMLDNVFGILDLMRECGVTPNNETFEFLANSAVRQVRFVTGAVSMATLPEPLAAEVAFVGRSNVGKSSLVNMLCNRKALAYVSGRPGKTQQFNYFLVNEKDPKSQFYMVDLPGVGYAKVPKPIQDAWIVFMQHYFRYRTSLRLVFHLVDGRHGALADDEELMAEMAACGRALNYVVVLTKMDKMDKQKAKQSILDKTRAALIRNGCPADTPIVLTSSASKLGRDHMWRHLQSALANLAEPNR